MPKNRKARYLLVLVSSVAAFFLQFVAVFDRGIDPVIIAILIGVMAFSKSAALSNFIGVVLVLEPVPSLVVLIAQLLKGGINQRNPFLLVAFTLIKLYPMVAVWVYKRFIQSKPADLMIERAPKLQKKL